MEQGKQSKWRWMLLKSSKRRKSLIYTITTGVIAKGGHIPAIKHLWLFMATTIHCLKRLLLLPSYFLPHNNQRRRRRANDHLCRSEITLMGSSSSSSERPLLPTAAVQFIYHLQRRRRRHWPKVMDNGNVKGSKSLARGCVGGREVNREVLWFVTCTVWILYCLCVVDRKNRIKSTKNRRPWT